jgi:hypothetical protein
MERLHSASLRFRQQQQAPTDFAWDRTIQDQTLVTEETRLHECTYIGRARGFRLLCQTGPPTLFPPTFRGSFTKGLSSRWKERAA